MSIELTCLGGAAAWPNPGQGCSSYLVRSEDESILLDAGPDTLLELRKHTDIRTISAVIVSHWHSDHILDLIPFRYALVYGPEGHLEKIPLWLPPGGIAFINGLASALGGHGEDSDGFWESVFVLQEYDPGKTLDFGPLTVRFARTVHPAMCYAMRLDAENGSSLCYTADTGTVDSVLDLAKGCNILISEATMPEEEQRSGRDTGHLKPSEAGLLASKADVDTLVLSHLWSERDDSVVIHAASASFAGKTLVAKPGLVVHD